LRFRSRGTRSVRSRSGRGPKASPRPRLYALALLAVAVFLLVAGWSWIDAQTRAVVVLSSVLETPVLTPTIEALTSEPRVEDTVLAGSPTLIARPGGEGPWPTLLFVNGTVPQGRTLPEVQNLARGLARAGYLVVVPDLPGMRNDEITEETVSSALETTRAVADFPDARDGRVGLVGISTGATIALLAAEDTDVGEHVSVVAGIAPYTDIRTVLSIATTGHYLNGDEYVPYKADPFLSYVAARSVVAALPSGEDRDKLRAGLEEVARLDPDPLAELRTRSTDDLSPEAGRVVELLANDDPERFDELYAALPPGVRASMDRLSPLGFAERLTTPVELTSGAQDKYFPISESFALARIAPNCRVTVAEPLDHGEPVPSVGDLPAFGAFDGFVVRSLREARLKEPAD
jgi:pimeloyl-ACP methyl ester carboxylesterase